MNILVCPGAFKGTFSASEVTKIIANNLREQFDSDITIKSVPMADGGEGSLNILNNSMLSCKKKIVLVQNPLGTDELDAPWLLCEESNTAFIEAAQIVGYHTLSQNILAPRLSNSFGLGLVMANAMAHGVKEITLLLGDTVTIDAGLGCINALGVKFLSKIGSVLQLNDIVENLSSICYADMSNFLDHSSIRLTLAVDTKTPLCGFNGLVRLYGAQKGVVEKNTDEFEHAINHYADIVELATGKRVHDLPGASAGGGIAASLFGFFEADIISGFDLLAGFVGLESMISEADLVITGEGRIDQQTIYGKVPWGVSQLCRKHKVPVIGITGTLRGITKSECSLDEVFETQNQKNGNYYIDIIKAVDRVSTFIKSKY